MPNWSTQAIDISKRFGALIIPLYNKKQPGTKLNPTKPSNKDLPPNKLPSSDPDIIKAWAEYHPGYGVVPTDKFLILDVDIKENQNGKQSIKFLIENGLPSDGFVVQSPSGGLHFYLHKPTHYQPAQSTGAFINIRFDNADLQAKWEKLQESSNCESTGLDTRYGWSYVAGPGSDFDGEKYILVKDADLAFVPSTMHIGYKSSSVKKDNPKKKPEPDIPPGSIKQDRNTHATNRTFALATQLLPESIAKAVVKSYVEAYCNDDGEAPTFDEMWDMYNRAIEKIKEDQGIDRQDKIEELIRSKIYVVTGERVMDVHNSSNISKFSDFRSGLENQPVMVEVGGDMKPRNPADIWRRSPERLTARDTIFSIAHPHGLVTLDPKDDNPHFNEFKPPKPISLDSTPYTEVGHMMYEAAIRTFKNVLTDPDDYSWFMKWVGSLLFMPTYRPAWHWHIYSKGRGIGKDVMTTVVCHLYGISNVRHLGIEVFQDKANVEFFKSGLLVFSDFKRITEKRGDVLAKFKALTVSGKGRMRDLYQSGVEREVSCRFIFISNHEDDFPVDDNDRRIYKACSSSLNKSLDPFTAALTESIAIDSGKSEGVLSSKGITLTEADREYAKAKLFDMFKNCGYEEMAVTIDCPYNRTKEESLLSTAPVYIEEVKRYIDFELFVCASDIVTQESIRLLMQAIGVKTSLGQVMTTLLEQNIIRKVPLLKNKSLGNTEENRTHAIVKSGALSYDADLGTIFSRGLDKSQAAYYIRRGEHWGDPLLSRQVSREYKKIIGYPGIVDGWDEERAEMLKKNKVVTLHDGSV